MWLAATPAEVEGLTPWIGLLGAPSIIILVVLMIITGRLLPRSWVADRMGDKDIIISRQADYIEVLKQNNALLQQGNETSLALTQATTSVVAGVPRDVS